MSNSHPIGVFDSGIGGLSIAKCIRDTLPLESIIYFADTRYAPYGDKSDDFIARRAHFIVTALIERGAKAIVVACNTATTSTIQNLRNCFQVPIIGVEPGTKPAALNSKSGVVGVLATPRTLATASFERLLRLTSGTVKVELQACPDLVPQVELLELDSAKTQALVESYVAPLLEKGADHIVLGCTHYNFLEALIAKIAGPDIAIINTAQAVVNQLARQLNYHQLSNNNVTSVSYEFLSSGDLALFQAQIERLWGAPVAVFQLEESTQ